MRVLALLSLSILFAGACSAGTHCTSAETVAFSCSLSASRVISLCLAKQRGNGAPQLSYRIGRLGSAELVFPSSPADSAQKFRYAHYFRYQVDRTEVSFSNAGTEYAVFDYYEGEEKPAYSRGVRVIVRGVDHELQCKGAVVSRLVQLEAVIPCDTESALSSCR